MIKSLNEPLIFIYTTYPDLSTAREICQALLNQNLIACANVLPQMQSFYRWENQMEESDEVVGILKTRKSLYNSCKDAILEKHPYSTPCILAIDITDANEAYGKWLISETKSTTKV